MKTTDILTYIYPRYRFGNTSEMKLYHDNFTPFAGENIPLFFPFLFEGCNEFEVHNILCDSLSLAILYFFLGFFQL